MKPTLLLPVLATLALASCNSGQLLGQPQPAADPAAEAPAPPIPTPRTLSALSAKVKDDRIIIMLGKTVQSIIQPARPDLDDYEWHMDKAQIVVKSSGGDGPAVLQLFDSRSGALIDQMFDINADRGPDWAKKLAD